MTVPGRVRRLHLSLPDTPRPLGNYVPAVEAGNLLFVSGMLPIRDGAAAFVGRVGQELNLASGRQAAQLAAANALAAARDAVGLNRLAGVARLAAHVACAPDFRGYAGIADAASEYINQVFHGSRHSRLVFGHSSLPGGMPIELELIFVLHPKYRHATKRRNDALSRF